MAVTLKSIAEATGLSNQTVSDVLGNKAHLFRPETQELVRATAQRLGYRPNASARAMRAGRSNAIALLLSTERGRSTLFAGFLQGVEAVAHASGLHLIVTALPDQQLTDPQFVPKMLREAMADGLLLNYYLRIPAAMEDLVTRNRIPSIWTNARRDADCVFPDDFGASRAATRTLIQQGHRDIAYVDATHDHPLDRTRDHYSAFDRHAGYREAMREAGLPVREFLPPRKLDPVEVAEALTAWLGGPQCPSALVTYCDIEVVALLHVAPVLKLRLPQDLTMVTFAEQPTHYGLAPVTTMLIPAEELGRVAVEMLMKKIAAPARALAPCPVPFGRHAGAACGRVSGDEMSRPKVS